MKRVFIFFTFVLLASCQKEAIQSTVTETPRPDASGAITQTPLADTNSRFKLAFTPLSSGPSVLLRKHPSGTIAIEPAELQFTIGSIRYRFKLNITAKEYIQYGLKHIFIEVRKDPSTYQINIIGTSTQISPGAYPYNIIPCCGGTGNTFAPNSAMFLQMQYDYEIVDQDFSLQVVSYENGYLDATFYSSRVSNGIIRHLKIIE